MKDGERIPDAEHLAIGTTSSGVGTCPHRMPAARSPTQTSTARHGTTLASAPVQALILLASSIAIALFFWPGNMDADALRQIGEARTGSFYDWYTPILDWMWRGLFLLHISPGFVLWVTIYVFMLAVFELLRTALSRSSAVIVTLIITLYPPVLGFLGSLDREDWFGASALAAYALLARSIKTQGAQRVTCSALALVASWFAMAARQNGVLAVLPAVFISAAILLHSRPTALTRRHRLWAKLTTKGHGSSASLLVATSVLLLIAFYFSQRFLTYDIIGAAKSYPEQQLLQLDLASLSLRTGKVLIPRSDFPSQSLKLLSEHYSPYTALPLIVGPGHPLLGVYSGKIDRQLEEAWIRAIFAHPIAYLKARWQVWSREIAWSSNAFEPYHDGIDANTMGYKASFPLLNRFALAYLGDFTNGNDLSGGPLHRVWAYLFVGFCTGIDLLRRKRSTSIRLVGCLCCTAVIYYLPYFFLAAGQAFRYAWFPTAATVIGLSVDVAERIHSKIRSEAAKLLKEF